jgi:hypothetical protein
MRTTLGKIVVTLNDYKICTSCDSINWHKNVFCHYCQKDDEFSDDECDVDIFIKNEYDYFEGEGYDELTIDSIEIKI